MGPTALTRRLLPPYPFSMRGILVLLVLSLAAALASAERADPDPLQDALGQADGAVGSFLRIQTQPRAENDWRPQHPTDFDKKLLGDVQSTLRVLSDQYDLRGAITRAYKDDASQTQRALNLVDRVLQAKPEDAPQLDFHVTFLSNTLLDAIEAREPKGKEAQAYSDCLKAVKTFHAVFSGPLSQS